MNNEPTITIRPTDKIVLANDSVPLRLWEGTAADGTPVRALVMAVGFADDAIPEALAKLLKRVPLPTDPQTN